MKDDKPQKRNKEKSTRHKGAYKPEMLNIF